MRCLMKTWVLVLLLALSGCGSSVPELSPLPHEGVVLAFGDSLTRGTGAAMDQAYPAVLEGLIGRRVINAGVPGEESDAGLARLPRVLDEVQPDLMILCHGGNDLLRRRDHEDIAANLRAMVDLAHERGIAVVMVAVPEPRLSMRAPDFYADIAGQAHVPLQDDVVRHVLRRNALKSDAVHPNAEGYRVMAEALAELLREAGAVIH